MGSQSIFLTSNRETVAWIIVCFATFGLAFPFMLLRAWYLLLKKNKAQ